MENVDTFIIKDNTTNENVDNFTVTDNNESVEKINNEN